MSGTSTVSPRTQNHGWNTGKKPQQPAVRGDQRRVAVILGKKALAIPSGKAIAIAPKAHSTLAATMGNRPRLPSSGNQGSFGLKKLGVDELSTGSDSMNTNRITRPTTLLADKASTNVPAFRGRSASDRYKILLFHEVIHGRAFGKA